MARFTLGRSGAAGINSGIGNVFQTLAQAPYYRQQAQQNAEFYGARAANQGAAADKHAAEADSERYTLGQRQGIDAQLAADPAMEPFRQAQLRAYKLVGPQHMRDFSSAGETEQKIGAINAIQQNPALATAVGQAYAATSGKMPFADVGQTGRSMNQLTGTGGTLDATLAKIYDAKIRSEIGENRGQAQNSIASAGQHEASTKKLLAETGLLGDTDTSGALSGKPLTNAQRRSNTDVDEARKFMSGVPKTRVRSVMNKAEFDLTPADKDLLGRIKKARTAKYGEAAVPEEHNQALGLDSAVVNDLMQQLQNPKPTSSMFGLGADRPMTEAETLAGIKKLLPQAEQGSLDDYVAAAKDRMGRKPAMPAAPAATAPKTGTGPRILPKGIPPGSEQIGTSNGKPVYLTPNGKKLIVG